MLRGWLAQHPVHILDPSFKDTECVSCLPAGRRREAAKHWLMWWLSAQRMDLSHTLTSMNKDSSLCGTGTPNTRKHLRHALGHVSPWASWNMGSPKNSTTSLEIRAFVNYCEVSVQLQLQHVFGQHTAGVLIHLEVKWLAFIKMDKTPWIAMDSPLHENVATGNEPKVAPGWLRTQAPGSASHCAQYMKNTFHAAFSFYSHQSEFFLLLGLFFKLS